MTVSKSRLTIGRILEWADEHRERTGLWPSLRSGRVRGAEGERWDRIDEALKRGARGLRGGSSLARLLEARRDKMPDTNRPPLSARQVVRLADEHHRRTRRWPGKDSGRVVGGPGGMTWTAVDKALRRGHVRGGEPTTLAQLLAEHGRRNRREIHRLTMKQILEWADFHHRRTGRWPVQASGPVRGAPGEQWKNVDMSLRVGTRGLPGGSSLARLLARYRGVPNRAEKKPRLTIKQILEWAERHKRRTGSWPDPHSGPIPRSGGETWMGIQAALQSGRRGLSGGTTLPQLLARRRGRPYRRKAPDLTIRQILKWAEAHCRRTGRWPSEDSGPVRGAPGERWGNIQSALYKGYRGLPSGWTLATLLDEHFG